MNSEKKQASKNHQDDCLIPVMQWLNRLPSSFVFHFYPGKELQI
ncbi:hypothetical protein TNCV_2294381, partial [Trichonephila clavipes]